MLVPATISAAMLSAGASLTQPAQGADSTRGFLSSMAGTITGMAIWSIFTGDDDDE